MVRWTRNRPEKRLKNGHQFQWIVDPLDGTTNYVHGLPNYSVSVASKTRRTDHRGSSLRSDVMDECLHRQRSAPERCSTVTPIRASSITEMSQALLAASFPAFVSVDSPEVGDLTRVIPHCQAFRRLGSAALNLCYVGRWPARWLLGHEYQNLGYCCRSARSLAKPEGWSHRLTEAH